MNQNPLLIVVIPAFNELSLLPVLNSLKDASLKNISTQVIVVFNSAENSSQEIKNRNKNAHQEVIQWKSRVENDFFQVRPELYQELNEKKAGVGLARKLGMDLAANIFSDSGYNGVIVCLDADCLVDENYFLEIHKFFKLNPKIQGCNIKFEHRFVDGDRHLQEAIIQYELHLRYYRMALKLCDYPYAFHTVGSCMAVTRDAYIGSKGMNTKKAGEDFYFLQKIFSQFAFGEINSTTVYPLGRLSDRVPFGTGAALSKWKESNTNVILTYQFAAFLELKMFFKKLHQLGSFEEWREFFDFKSNTGLIHQFLKEEGFLSDISNIMANTKSKDQLSPKFYRWFNNFKILKCLNYLRDVNYPQSGVLIEAEKMLVELGLNSQLSSLDMLKLFRNLDELPINETH